MNREAFEKATTVPDELYFNEIRKEYCWSAFPTVTAPFNDTWESFCDGWQAALQSGEPVAEIQEYKHWLFCDNGERDGFEWRKRQVNNGDLLSLPHGTKLYTTPQPVVPEGYVLVPRAAATEVLRTSSNRGGAWEEIRAALLSAGKGGE